MRSKATFSPAQCRAARALLGWSQAQLSARAHIEVKSVKLFEADETELAPEERARIGEVFAGAGVLAIAEGLAGEGVRYSRAASSLGSDSLASLHALRRHPVKPHDG